MELCEENDVGPVEGSESALLQSSCSSDLLSEDSTTVSICHVTELQTLMKLNEESQENAGDAEKLATEEDKDLQLKNESQNKMFDSTTSEAEGKEENISDVSVTLLREVEVNRDTGTVESNMTTESDFLQTSPDAHIEALKISEIAEKVPGETDTILKQSDISIIPQDSHREEAHSKSSPVIHKRKMGSTRRPLKGNKGQREEHDEKEIFSLEDEPSPDESRHTAVNVCDISESQTFSKIHAGSQENTGDVEIVPADGDTERHLENKTFESTAFGGEATEENICEASVLVKEVEFIGDTVTVDSNMTTESDLIQNDTSSDAKLEALKVSDNAEREVQKETDEVPKQSDTTIIPEDTQREEAHSEFTVIHKRKMGSTRRPLRGKNAQRKEKEHLDENETPDSEGIINVEEETIRLENEPSLDESTLQSLKVGVKEQEIEICEKNDVGPVEGSESALLQSSCSSDLLSEESIAVSICHVTESQTLMKPNEVSRENAGVAEKLAAEEDKDLQLKTESQNKMFDSTTSEAEGTEENISDVSVTLLREVEVNRDTGTVESNMTTESDFLQTSPDAHIEALKISENAEKEVPGETDTILKQSDISIIPDDSHREDAHSKSSPVIHKRKMGSTRRPLKGNKGQKPEHDEKEIFSLEDESSPDESRHTAVNVCDISESQTFPKIHAGSQENTGDVEIVSADGDTERHLENKTFDSKAFGGEATEENICEASVLVKEVEFIGDTVTVDSNMTTESDMIQNDTSSDAKLEALKVSDNAECEVQEETDAVPKQSDTTIIPEETQREEAHSEFTVIHKRKMGSTRRPLRGKNAQRKEKEHLDENETPDSEVQKETDEVPKQSDTTIIPEDTQREEAHSEFTVIHKRKMGSTRRPLRGKNAQRKEKEHLDENETPDSEGIINVEEETISLENEPSTNASPLRTSKNGVKEQEMELCEENDVGPVEGSESAFLQSSCSSDLLSEESTAVSICHVTESQTLMKLNEESQENAGDAEKLAAEEEKDLKLKTESQNKIFDSTTSEAEGTEENISDVSVTLLREVEVNRDTGTLESNMTTESNFLQTSPDAHIEALKISENAEKEVSGETDTILQQSDISIIPDDSHREEAHSKSSPVIHKRKMGSTRRPLKGNKGQRPEHDEKEIFSLEDEPSPHESRNTAVNVCDISELQTLPKIHAGSQENTGDVEIVSADGDTERHLENKTFDSTTFGGEATEENICEASVLVKEVEFIGDTVTVDSNMTTESDLIQNDTSSDAKLEALKVSDNAECEVQEETDAVPKQSDTTIIPEDTQREEAHSEFTVIHKRKMGSTRRPLRGKNAQRKEKEHLDENETPDSEGIINVEEETIRLENEPSLDESTLQSLKVGLKEQEIEICEKNDVGPVEGSESALLQSSCSSDLLSEESTAVSICHVTELQTLVNLNEESQENAGVAEKLAAEEDKDLQLKTESQNKMFDSTTSEAEGTEENISDVSVTLLREVEVIGDTGTVESNMTTESDFLQTSPDAHIEALKISENAEKEVSRGTDTILKQSDISIFPQDSHREEAHSKSSPVIHKRKMGSTRRPLKGNKGQRLEDEPSPNESRYSAVNVCDISESQILPKIHVGSQENTGDVEIVSADGDTERHLENKTFDSTAFGGEATEENICEASVLVKEVKFIGDTVTVDSNMTTESDLIQNDTSSDAKLEALKVSDNAECEVQEETDTVPKQSDTTIIPEDIQREEAHSEFTVIHKRKMGSTRRPLRGKNAQRKEKEHLDENETPDSEGSINVVKETISLEDEPSLDESTLQSLKDGVKEQEIEICEKNDVGPVEGSKSTDLQSLCSSDLTSEESTVISICHITESQTLMKLNEESQDNAGDAERVAVGGETDLHLEIKAQIQTSDSTSEAEATEENTHDASVLVRKIEIIGDTVTVDSNMTTESDFIQNYTSSDAKLEALKVSDNAECEVQEETDAVPKQSDTTIIPEETQREEAHSEFTVIHKRKMGSTRRPLRGNKGQRQEHDEKEIFSLEDEPSPDESRNTAVNVCDISESQTFPKVHAGSQENTGDVEIVPADGDTERHLENKTFDSTTFGGEATEENICEASVLVKEVEFIGDTVTVDSNMTTESDLIQNDTSSDAKLEALKVSDNAEREVQEETDAVPKQSDTTIIPEDIQREEAHSEFTVIHKRKMGSTRRPLRGKNAQRKENEHLDENETPDSEGSINVEKETISLEDEPSLDESTLQSLKDGVKEQEMEICEKNDVGPVEGSKSTDLQSLCSSDLTSEESTVISICHITESQTLMKLNEESQDNDGYAERVAVGGETDLHVEIKAQVKTSDSTSEAEATEENICEASALVKEVEFIGDTVTVESNITTESDFLQSSPDSLKVSQNSVKEVSGETDTILKQSDISIIPEDSHREEAHSKSSPVIHKRKMGSTRRPLKGNKGKRKDHDEKEIFSLEDEPSPDESRHTAVNVCDISESQTFPKIHAGSQKNTGDVEIAPAEGDTEQHLENKTFDSTAFGGEATEENICEASVLVKEVEFIGDTVTVESNITTESVFIQSSPDALKVSQNSAKEVLGETDTILKQSNISIIPEDSHREEAHSKSSPVIHKRKMGSTRRPLKGKNGQRNEKEHHDENETPDSEHMFNVEKETISLEDQPMYTAVSDILESQTLTKFHAESQEDYKDVERALVGRDTEPRSVQTEMTTLNSATFEGEGTEEIICEASVVVKEIEFIGDTVSMESNMTIKSDLLQSDISTDAKPEALMSEIENEGKTDTIPKQSDTNIIPEVPHGEEVHTKLNLNVQKRKMGSTCRPLRGNKGQRKVRVESEEKNGNSEPLSEEEDTETHLEIQNQDNVVDHNVTQEFLNIRDNKDEERKTTKTVEELCDDLKLEQRSDVSQTQSGPSQDDTGSHLLEVPERTADFVIDRFAGRSHSDLFLSDALLAEETQIHVSSEDVLPTEMAEMHPVSKRSMQKRKMGSTRKRGKRMVNDEEVEEEKDGEAENTTNEDGTTKSEENLTVEEAIVGSPVPQQLFSSSADKESHEIQDIVSKSDVQTDISEQNDPNSTINPELSIEFECYSNVAAEMVSDLPLGDADTYLGQKQSVIPKESHREDQSSLNPIVQKRKMGSTRKTLRGNKGLGKEEESKKMDRESEEMTQEQDTEPHLATSERKTASKFDEEVEQNFPVEFPYPVAFSKMFPESENGGKEVSLNIHDLSEVSEEKESTGNDSNSENEAINLYDGTKDKFVLTVSHKEVDQTVSVDVYVGSEPEQTENTGHVFPTQELKSTQDDVVHEISSTQEKRRKMGSTRRNPRVIHGENMADNEDVLGVAEDRETKKAEDDLDDMLLESSIIQSKEVSSVSTTDLESEILGSATDLKEENHHQNNSEPSGPTVPETLQLVNADVTKHPQSETVTTENRRKMGSTRKNLREGRIQGKRDGYEETETADTNLQMSQDSEMSLGDQTTHDYFNQPEDSLLSEIERALNKTSQSSMSNDRESVIKEPNHISNAPDLSMPENSEIKSLQPTPLAHSEPNSPGRRRKMGSTRKNPRQQLKAEREDEDKEDEEKDENLKTNKQENKDLERVEVSIIPNITENKLNKEYLDVSSAHTSSSELEESTNPVSQERTSPSTKRKFGSRRTNKGKKGLGSLATSDFGNELEDGDHKLDISEVEDKLCSDDSEVCDPCLTLQPENQPITHPVSEQRNMEVKNEEVAAKGTVDDPVSSEQIIKHDRSTGAKQAVNLKNRISDAEVVQFNVVMVGNSSVGKTSFIRRFHEGQFTEDYRSTIGVDTCIQTIDLPDRTVKLQIWDTAGQERFHSITSQVFHRADGLLLMYEITCSNSFISVRDWISQAQERAPDDVIMMLLGNKNDSLERAVQIQEGADLAREYNINFMECSAATGANVSESMRTLAELLVQRKSEKERHTTLKREPSQKKSGCC
uniref:small monomeric GTPase n=1 Tax=Cyprinus carpio carpio TaxID=630221 RepID=A0A9J7XLT5_CYPCA